MEKQDARKYLVSKGFNPGQRGRFSKEMLEALKTSGLTFTRPVKDPKNPVKSQVSLM
jgi:hypothetical protein